MFAGRLMWKSELGFIGRDCVCNQGIGFWNLSVQRKTVIIIKTLALEEIK